MKKWTFLLALATIPMFILLAQSTEAIAQPAGEVKLTAPMYGYERWIPRVESMHASDVMNLLFDPLVGTTPDGKMSSKHGIAQKWEMSPDALTWTFYLRKGVRFHDGTELTAKDVKFSLDQFALPDSTSGYADRIRKAIKTVEIKDSYTVVVRCKEPTLFLLGLISNISGLEGMILPKDYFEKGGAAQFQKRPLGSGPYRFHSAVSGSFIKLEATDRHWREGVPRYKYMTFLIIPEESSRIAMLKTGEADITRVSRERVKEVIDAGLQMITKEEGTVVHLNANMPWTSPVFSDIRFRKALNLAIDREAIIKHIFGGLAQPVAMYPGPNLFVCGADSTLKPYPYNPQEARRLLKEGGYEGHEFTMASYTRSGCPEYPKVVETVAGYWEKVGLKPKIFMTEYATWREKEQAHKTQNTVSGQEGTSSPECGEQVGRLVRYFYSKSVWSVAKIPELDAKFDRMLKSLDTSEVNKIMGDIYRYVYDNHLMIPVCVTDDMIATTKRIPKWDPGLRRNERNINALIRQP